MIDNLLSNVLFGSLLNSTRLPAVRLAFDGLRYDRYLTEHDTIIMCEEGTVTVSAIMTAEIYESLNFKEEEK